MRIGIYHGYELTGSGSNEYTRYLAKTYITQGHEVHVICREPAAETLPFVSEAYQWSREGNVMELFKRETTYNRCVVHELPHGDVRPVYLTDKQRSGNVKAFIDMTDEALEGYHDLNERLLKKILKTHRLDVLHANHVVYQPISALRACEETNTPLVVYPHGSSIEYTVKKDARFKELALAGLLAAKGLIIGNHEVRDRILNLYPEHREALLEKTKIVGVGVDTTLFQPVAKANRKASIQKLIATNGSGGKKPSQMTELQERLLTGGIAATRQYWNAYAHDFPDENLNEKLANIPWEENILLFVGAFTVGKGLHSLITALPKIRVKQPKTHLVIVGAGAYREVLEALVFAIASGNKDLLFDLVEKGKDLDRNDAAGPWEDVHQFLGDPMNLAVVMESGKGLDKYVHFLGRLDHSRLSFLFPCADFAIFPSVVPEAYPLVLMESLSNGVLPVVSYFSGFKDGVDELVPYLGELLVEKMKISVDPAGRIEGLVQNLVGLLADKSLNSIGPKLREIAVTQYDWKLRTAAMVEAYQHFCKD